jgi:hypothetical protein
MRNRTPIAHGAVIIRVPDGPEISWRRRRLVSLGADADLAAEIAESDVDVHDIARLLDGGCSLELAWMILRPLEPQAAASAGADDTAS